MAYSTLFQQAVALYQQDKLTEAASVYRDLLKQVPNHGESHYNLATIYSQLADWNNAIQHYHHALACYPHAAPIHYNLAITLLNAKRLPQAITHLKLAAQGLPDHFAAQHLLACTLLHQNQHKKALPYFQAAEKINPGDEELQLNMGILYLGLHELTKAADYLQRALKLNNTLWQAEYNLSLIYTQLGDNKRALHHGKNALKLRPQHFDTLFQLVFIYKNCGQWQQARQCCEQALLVRPNDPSLSFIKTALTPGANNTHAPSAYITNLFNYYASFYDHHLTQVLAYDVPEQLLTALKTTIPLAQQPLPQLIDLGCGSGLCGPWARKLTKNLVGIDLSSHMLTKARQTKHYDELIEASIHHWLVESSDPVNAMISADVWVYIGDLAPIFKAVRHRLTTPGWFAFSIECAAQDLPTSYRLNPTGRFSHTPVYIQQLASSYEFNIKVARPLILRKEDAHPVQGMIYVLTTH